MPEGTQVPVILDLAAGSSRMANIVLQFPSAGVTHVLFFEPWVGYGVFMQQAEKQ